MRRDARFELGFVAFVIAFDHLRGLVETRDHRGSFVRNFKFDEFANGTKADAEFGEEISNTFAGFGGDGDRVGIVFTKTRHQFGAAEAIDFVENHQRRFAARADFFEDGVDGIDLVDRVRVADVNDVEKQVGLDDFFQSGFEGFDEAVRKFANETHCVGEEDVLVSRQTETARGWIERGEQAIFGEDRGAGKRVE